jgi:hypothetical protein
MIADGRHAPWQPKFVFSLVVSLPRCRRTTRSLVTRETRPARDTALEPAHGALGWAERVEDFPPISDRVGA